MTAKKVRFTGIIQARDADTSYEYGDEVEQGEEGEGDHDSIRACLITLGILALFGVIVAIVFFTVREVGH
jgi:hypothetical protein